LVLLLKGVILMDEQITCYQCDKVLNEDDDIINIYDGHTYCLDCNDKVIAQWEAKGYVYNMDDDTIINTSINEVVDDHFIALARALGMKSGDISPIEQDKLDKAVATINKVIEQWIENNE
jgi:hypothetical protein